jgi:hypothetical protein
MIITSAISLFRRGGWLLLLVPLLGVSASGQNPIFDALARANSDVVEIRRRAEAGDNQAEVKWGDILASHFWQSEALIWYRKAAEQGNIDAKYHVGQMLLFGSYGDPPHLVQPDRAAGLLWTFMAATNLNPSACHNMIKAVGQGLGTAPDPIAAYAWLIVFSETPNSAMLGRLEMNEMNLRMSTDDIRRAQSLAVGWKAGHWQLPVIRVIPEGDHRLKATAIATGLKIPFAVINGQTLSPGESASIALNPETVCLKCLKIEENSVVVALEGEDQPRVLRLLH